MLVFRSDQKWNNHLYEMSKLPENEFKKRYSVINIWAKVRKLIYALKVKDNINQIKDAAVNYTSNLKNTTKIIPINNELNGKNIQTMNKDL